MEEPMAVAHNMSVDEQLRVSNAKILESLTTDDNGDDAVAESMLNNVAQMSSSNFMSALTKMALCPVCRNYYTGNVYQCRNGHSLCINCLDTCIRQRTPCPQCRCQFGHEKIRNISFESLLGELDITVPCRYNEYGCEQLIKYSKVHEHWRVCNYRPANCFFHGCAFTAKNNVSYVEHLCSVHETIPTDLPDSEYFPLDIQNVCSQMNSMHTRHNTPVITYVHKFMDDYIIVHILFAERGNYYVSLYSMNNKYYVCNITFQVPHIAFVSTTEVRVVPSSKLEELYKKMTDGSSQQFYKTYNDNGYLWHTAILAQTYMNQLANYPNMAINFTLMMPTPNQMADFTKVAESPDFKLMDNPVEDTLPPEIAEAILAGDGGYNPNQNDYFGGNINNNHINIEPLESEEEEVGEGEIEEDEEDQ
jgi:hypothetical protein